MKPIKYCKLIEVILYFNFLKKISFKMKYDVHNAYTDNDT